MGRHFIGFFFLVVLLNLIGGAFLESDNHIKVLTVATDATDGYLRYNRSARIYDINVETLGMGTKWLGGDMYSLGGGYKVNLLRTALEPLKDQSDLLVLFTDSYDVLFLTSLNTIATKFNKFDANVVFSAETYCWPDESLIDSYPPVSDNQSRFLNSGMFIGFASDLYEILKEPIGDTDDDQLYYTNIFLNTELREKHRIKLDHKSEIFQNLHGSVSKIKLDYDLKTGDSFILNMDTDTTPSIIHGNGYAKTSLNSLSNYIAGAYSNGVCHNCEENLIELDMENEESLPIVTIGAFIEKPTPFLEEFLQSIVALKYPKSKLKLFIHNAIEYHSDVVNTFIDTIRKEYSSVKTILSEDNVKEADARSLALTYSLQRNSDYLFVIDAEARLENADTLIELIKYNRSVIAPLLVRPGEAWSNFWGALNPEGYYARSHDYMDIIKGNTKGIWNVPFISACYLIKRKIISQITYEDELFDAEMAFGKGLRKQDIFMFTVNLNSYGHLINDEAFDISVKNPDLYMLDTNRIEWENRYIHPDYWQHREPNATNQQPCPDVYWFPIVTDKFCDELIEIMENFGKWSDGSNSDTRLKDGYEAVPTRDIHMNQVGLETLWLNFLRLYITPLQENVFIGYYHNPPRSLMNFVVRYRPTEQPYLRPHHDSSTYTINVALNTAGLDYEGGGCRFIRYDCSVADTKKGWMLMHPGRLTHFHEGMLTTSGTRYIAISFIDP